MVMKNSNTVGKGENDSLGISKLEAADNAKVTEYAVTNWLDITFPTAMYNRFGGTHCTQLLRIVSNMADSGKVSAPSMSIEQIMHTRNFTPTRQPVLPPSVRIRTRYSNLSNSRRY